MAKLTHLGRRGEARMVDVSAKAATERVAIAEGRVVMSAKTLDLVLKGNAKKGDVLGAARMAGIMAAKKTHELIPLCHPLALTKVEVDIAPDGKLPGFVVRATCKLKGQTGVEMEALTAVSVACLTIYDMVKAAERGMRIEGHSSGREARRQVGHLSREGEVMALLPVADALARVLEGAAPLPAERVAACGSRRPRARRGSRRAAHAAAGRRLRHGRLCGARRGCRERALHA